jgi:hypothetical protein
MQSQTTAPKEEGPTIPSNPDEDPTNPQEDPTTPPKKPFEPFTVPAGCTYYSLSNSTIYSAGERVTVPFSEGDYLETNHYFYRYHAGTDEDHPYEGWNVYTNTDDYGTYEPISETVLGLPVAYMDGTFAGCKYMTTTPEIPKTVKFMRNTFKECRMITEPPVLPEGVEDLSYAFAMCSWLKTPPEIPDSVTSMKGTFFLCIALEAAPRIPEGIEDLTETFQSCGRMKEAPELPEGLRILDRTFFRCDGLVTAPRIPDSVVSMRETFCECDSMVTASDFPPNVEDISYAYKDTLISQAPAIPAGVRWATSVFSGCYRLNGEVVIHAQFAANCYDNIFYGTHQEILLSGTSSQLEEIAAQYDNITVTQ